MAIRTVPATIATLLLAAGACALGGCEEGTFEEAGEEVDEATEDARDAIEDAGDEVEDAVDDPDVTGG